MVDEQTGGHVESVVRWGGERLRSWSIVPLRIVVGVGFLAHGFAKWHRGPEAFGRLLALIGVPLPGATAWLVTLLEIFGGVAILLGVFVALASVPLIASMLVAMFSLHVHYGFSSVNTIGLTAAGPIFGPPGYEINLLYIAALTVVALRGPGALSVGCLWARYRLPNGSASSNRPSR
jgi:putative oxidoreductase